MSNLAVKLQATAMLAQELHISLEDAEKVLDKMATEFKDSKNSIVKENLLLEQKVEELEDKVSEYEGKISNLESEIEDLKEMEELEQEQKHISYEGILY